MTTISLETKLRVTLIENYMPGRVGYKSGIRPNHMFPGVDYVFAGQLEFTDRELLAPGETCEALGSLIIQEDDLGRFKPGFSWHICEANKIVGFAELVSIESKNPVE